MKSSQKSPRRSLLFTPADSLRKIEKGARLGTDAIILDLEDAVSPDQKEIARQNVISALLNLDFGKKERLVRVNHDVEGELLSADLEAVASTSANGIVIPKAESAADIRFIDERLSTAERVYGRPLSTISLFVLVETALGIMNLKEIAQASPRIEALMFGAEDLAVDLGTTRSPAAWEVFHGRTAVVTAAAAYGLQAIDMVFVDLNNLADLEVEATFARQLGYSGKMAIHPGQVDVLNRIFAPSGAEVNRARRVVEAYQAHVAAGSGAFSLDGRMVDRPIVLAAEKLLERARLCRLFDE